MVDYAIEKVNSHNKITFEYTLEMIKLSESIKLERRCNKYLKNIKYQKIDNFILKLKVCKQVKSGGIIAIITIGKSKVFNLAKIIANSLDIPYISINPDVTTTNSMSKQNKFELNLHPSVNKLLNAIVDLIKYYKWTFVTVLFQEPNRIEDLIKYNENELNFQFRLISSNSNEWIDLIKEVKSSGSSHIIIDLETKLINKFLRIVCATMIIF